MLTIHDVTVRFGGVTAVERMGLQLNKGEILGLIGPNGAGKTTFINCVTGLLPPAEGRAQWRGQEVLGLPPSRLMSLGIARTFQGVASLHGLSVLEMVKLGARYSTANASKGRRALERLLVDELLSPLHLDRFAHAAVQTLSYGQRKAVDLARALAASPAVLMLDEPVAGLTAQEGMEMAALIRSVRDRIGCSVVMVEHKMDVVMSTCERIVVMAEGRPIFEGLPAQVQANSEVRRVYLGDDA